MQSDKYPFVLVMAVQSPTISNATGPWGLQGYQTETEWRKSYATKQGLMQAAHYWAKRNQNRQATKLLWRGGYYTNYVLFLTGEYSRVVMHAYQRNATKNFQSLTVDLTSIVSSSGLGEDVRGEAYKVASSQKDGV